MMLCYVMLCMHGMLYNVYRYVMYEIKCEHYLMVVGARSHGLYVTLQMYVHILGHLVVIVVVDVVVVIVVVVDEVTII